MTESEWDSCTDPEIMLRFLRGDGRLAERKARLFAVACCRRVWHLLLDKRTRRAVEVAERVAEGAAPPSALAQAEADTEEVYESTRPAVEVTRQRNRELLESGITWQPAGLAIAVSCAALAAAGACRAEAGEAAGQAACCVAMAVCSASTPLRCGDGEENVRWAAVSKPNAAVLRDVLGPLPFRPIGIEPSWRTPAVVALATGMYEERRFDEMPVLADALEEAGCDNREILGHLRQPGRVHARGCWCLDLLLGKA